MKVKVYTQEGKEKGEISLPADVFGCEINRPLMHQVVTLYLANRRQGTSKTKGRSEVSGGGKKPYRQKGTGRARAGSNTSSVWVRGGKAFGPVPRDYYSRIPRKMRKTALCSALSACAKDKKIFVIDKMSYDEPKTKRVVEMLNVMTLAKKKNLLIIDSSDANVYLAGRNVRDLNVKQISDINVYDILNCDNVIFGSESLIDKVKEVVAQ